MNNLSTMLAKKQVIAAVRSDDELIKSIASDVSVVFLLKSTIFDSTEKISRIKQSGKYCFIHSDLVDGLANDSAGMEYLIRTAAPDGIITTKKNIALRAASLGCPAILRVFMLDSASYESSVHLISLLQPAGVEILPGLMPKIISRAKADFSVPIISGGLITTQTEVEEAIAAGASAVSTTAYELWK